MVLKWADVLYAVEYGIRTGRRLVYAQRVLAKGLLYEICSVIGGEDRFCITIFGMQVVERKLLDWASAVIDPWPVPSGRTIEKG